MNWVLFGVLAYVLAQLAVGMLVSRRIASEADYLLAGRRLSMGLGTFTIFATWFGAETCIGAAGEVYKNGLAGGTADPFGYSACLLLMGVFFASRLRRMGLSTLADLFARRYSRGSERLAALLLAPTSVIWAAAQIRAFGQVIAAVSAFEVELAIVIATAVVIAYTAFGGLMADVYTDFIQGVALILGLVILLVVVVMAGGGMSATIAAADPRRLLGGFGESGWATLESWAIPICGSLFSQELAARVLASRSPRTARSVSVAGGLLYLVVGLIPVAIGIAGVRLLPDMAYPEQLLPQLARQHLPLFLYVLFAGALISAILSTVDSALLAASALVSHNVLLPLRPACSEAGKLRMARWCTVIFGLAAYALAVSAESVHGLVEEASAFGSAGIFVCMLFALQGNFGGVRSAYGALGTGAAVWICGAYGEAWSHPYLVSIAAATCAYLLPALIGKVRARQRSVSTV